MFCDNLNFNNNSTNFNFETFSKNVTYSEMSAEKFPILTKSNINRFLTLLRVYIYVYLTFSSGLIQTVEAYNNDALLFEGTTPSTTTARSALSATKRSAGLGGKREKSLFKYYYGSSSSSSFFTPCTFPVPSDSESWRNCNVEQSTRKKYNICAPEATSLLSEVLAITNEMDKIYAKHGDSCVCQSEKTHPSCWYQFAFAFVEDFKLPKYPIPQNLRAEDLCNTSSSSDVLKLSKHETTNNYSTGSFWHYNRSQVDAYGMKFAELLGERWKIGTCKEEVLFLIVKKSPVAVIYYSLGELVSHNTAHLTAPLNYGLKSMDEAMANANARLQSNSSTLENALIYLISIFEELLVFADQTYSDFNAQKRNPSGFKNHIPDWAIGVFSGCGVLLLIIFLGLMMVRTRARRVTVRSKQSADGGRRWKAAGFVGGMFKRGGDSNTGGGNSAGYTGLDVRVDYRN